MHETVPGDAAGLTGSCLGLLLPSGLGLSAVPGTSLHCSRLACSFLHFSRGAYWRHHSVPWLRITVGSWGLQGLEAQAPRPVAIYWPPLCCIPCSLNSQETSYLAPQTIVKTVVLQLRPLCSCSTKSPENILPSELKRNTIIKITYTDFKVCLAICLPSHRRHFNSPVLIHYTTHSLA